MKVKNVSSRLHHVGGVSIAPGQEADIPKGFETAINKDELVEIRVKTLTAAEKAELARKQSAIATAESKVATAKANGDADAIAAAEAELEALRAQ